MEVSRKQICAGIVTYNPEIKRLHDNYCHIKNQVDRVIICDNDSANIKEIMELIHEDDKIICMSENKGIATALNALCDYAYSNGYKWILTLDQDSICENDFIYKLSRNCDDAVAIVGPRIIYEGNEQYSNHNVLRLEKVKWVITSGSLTNTDIWKKVHGFDDILFIDKVDMDYGFRVNREGFSIIRDNEVELSHELGQMVCKQLFGHIIYVTNHSPQRIYYQCRNSIYLENKIGCCNSIKDICKIVIKIILYEKRKIKKLKNVIKGINDGFRMI